MTTTNTKAVTVLEVLAEAITDVPDEAQARAQSLTRLGDGQTNPDE